MSIVLLEMQYGELGFFKSPRFRIARHIQANADKLLAGIKQRSDGHIPLFTSDELKHYDDALLKANAIKKEFPPKRKRGRPRNPILNVPKGLL